MARTATKPRGRNRLFGKKESPKKPSSAQIAKKAYELYEKRGCCHGADQQDWFKAEKALRKA